ncbi:MAG: hypothetical protein FJ253_07130, partial [Phycisphaerae bacterium]|nr:hypothetical protein [Phycisphaerae bacterium]
MFDLAFRSSAVAVAVSAALAAASAPGASNPPSGPDRSDESLHAALVEIVGASAGRASLSTLVRSRDDRPVELLTLSADPGTADDRPGILVVAQLDGTRAATTEVAIRMASALLTNTPTVLDQVTVYLVPRANPDAAAAFRSLPGPRGALGSRPVDEDRDGRADEDGPADLDGNGVITLMRKLDPPPSLAAPTLVVDDKDSRMLREPQTAKGEVA